MDVREMWAALDRELDVFLQERPHNAKEWAFRVSSGTTGVPRVKLTRYEAGATKRFDGTRKALVCMGADSARLRNALIMDNLKYPDSPHILAVAASDLNDSFSVVINEFQPDSLFGFPSLISRVASYVSKETGASVTRLVLYGERVGASMEAFFRERFPRAALSMTYNAGELGPVSRPSCGFLPLNQYHPRDGVTITIDQEGGEGMIRVSKNISPTIRVESIETGDIGRLVDIQCPCGRSVAFEIVGRDNVDYVKVAGAILTVDESDRVMRLLPSIEDYHIDASLEVVEGALLGKLRLSIFPPHKHDEETIREQVSKELRLTPTRTLSDLVRDGIFKPLEIRWQEQPFPASVKRKKLSFTPL